MDDTRLWTVADVAEFLRLSKPQIYVLIEQFGLPVVVVPKNNKRFDPASVRKWLRELEVVEDDTGSTKTVENREGH